MIKFLRVGDQAMPVLSFFSSLATLTSTLMDFALTYMSPPGLLSLVATQVVTVVEPSTALLQLAKFVLTVILGELALVLLLPIFFLLFTRNNPLSFFANMTEALLINFGTASSIATFPVTLKCLTSKNGIDPKIASLILSIGVLINLASYPIIGLLYVARLEGKQMGVDQLVMAMLVLTMFGVPTASLTSILAVDWLIDRVDSVCKTLTDATAVATVAHLSASTLANGQNILPVQVQETCKETAVSTVTLVE